MSGFNYEAYFKTQAEAIFNVACDYDGITDADQKALQENNNLSPEQTAALKETLSEETGWGFISDDEQTQLNNIIDQSLVDILKGDDGYEVLKRRAEFFTTEAFRESSWMQDGCWPWESGCDEQVNYDSKKESIIEKMRAGGPQAYLKAFDALIEKYEDPNVSLEDSKMALTLLSHMPLTAETNTQYSYVDDLLALALRDDSGIKEYAQDLVIKRGHPGDAVITRALLLLSDTTINLVDGQRNEPLPSEADMIFAIRVMQQAFKDDRENNVGGRRVNEQHYALVVDKFNKPQTPIKVVDAIAERILLETPNLDSNPNYSRICKAVEFYAQDIQAQKNTPHVLTLARRLGLASVLNTLGQVLTKAQ